MHTAMVYVIQVCWQLANRIRTELVHLVGFIIRIYHDARSPNAQMKLDVKIDISMCMKGIET